MIDENIIEIITDYNKVFLEDNSWLKLKKYLLKSISPEERKKFSKRHYNSKKQVINDYEKNIIDLYFNKFNVKLVLKDSEKHNEKRKAVWER
mgnify:CR=1 FL=1|tara:strand:+ start:3819 stop:4094 length:276 start_codon:yes stop_codon:yes gene_type:complete